MSDRSAPIIAFLIVIIAMGGIVAMLPTAVAIWGQWASAYAVECKEAGK